MQKQSHQNSKSLKTMLNYIEVRASNGMKIDTRDLFNHMTDEDFMYVYEQGELTNLCNALAVDMHSIKDIKNEA